MLILGIETSCDETSIAVVKDGREVLSNIVYSQIEKHKEWGGVIPEVASRLHLEKIFPMLNETFSKFPIEKIDAIAVASHPGLIGSLLVGVNVAKTLAWTHNKPIIPVNHLYGHICSSFLGTDLEAPFICLLVSGGHTQIIKLTNYNEMEIIGETIDDAAGEAFDKVARLLDLPYPGGPHLDKLAQSATDKSKYKFTIPQVDALNFSFSGLKTAVLRLKEKISPDEWQENRANIAYAFQDCVARTLYKKLAKAVLENGLLNDTNETPLNKIVVVGGVAANSRIREFFKESFTDNELIFSGLKYCTDNAAMIASAGFFGQNKKIDPEMNKLDFEVLSRV